MYSSKRCWTLSHFRKEPKRVNDTAQCEEALPNPPKRLAGPFARMPGRV
ncbi:hypothetical protein [Escherichia phage IMM-001]|nr:hypothetical protein [Escherichia phage IMM-001]